MIVALIKNLINTGETLDIEFKSDRKKLSDSNIVEAVVCLSNRHGNASGIIDLRMTL